ncbi:MAG: hypothetical protein ACI9BD_001186 [Candidatus Marinamargulisbacteria bacterium]|jgi:hypothetical protein
MPTDRRRHPLIQRRPALPCVLHTVWNDIQQDPECTQPLFRDNPTRKQLGLPLGSGLKRPQSGYVSLMIKDHNISNPNDPINEQALQAELSKLFRSRKLGPDQIAKQILSRLYTTNANLPDVLNYNLRTQIKSLNKTPKGIKIIEHLFRHSANHGKRALVYALLRDKPRIADSVKADVLKTSISPKDPGTAKEIFLTMTKEAQEKIIKELKEEGKTTILPHLDSQ